MRVALHPEGVDRNRDSYKLIPLSVKSPSTRRAWIEIYKKSEGFRHIEVALHPEGAGRTQIVTLDFWT